MSEFHRSPSKVWWGNNEYTSPNAHRLNFEQWQQQTPEFEEEPATEVVTDMNQYEGITSFNTSSRENTPELNQRDVDWLNRNTSGSPNSHKSQDSGFSDSETSNSIPNETVVITGNFIKDCQLTDNTPIKNLNTNYKEKYSPKKCISSQINCMKKFHSAPTTPEQITLPQTHLTQSLPFTRTIQQPLLIYPNQIENSPNIIVPSNFEIVYTSRPATTSKIPCKSNSTPLPTSPLPTKSRTENVKFRRSRSSSSRSSPKVNRNLFSCYPSHENSMEDITKLNDDLNWTPQKALDNSRLIISPNNSPRLSRTVPIYLPEKRQPNRLNQTAPAGNELKYDPNEISFEETNIIQPNLTASPLSNDSQNLPITIDNFEPNPNHQSTPNNNMGPVSRRQNLCLQKKIFNNIIENKKEASPKSSPQPPPVAKWLEELSKLYEAECMVTLQSKSLAAHLSRQVAESATQATITIKSLFAHSKIIYSDFYTILRQLSNNKFEHLAPLIQSLNGNITEFILNYIINSQASSLTKTEERGQDVQEILQLCDFLRTATTTDCSIEELELNVKKLKALFREVERGILAIQIQLLINMIDEPTTELALRGAVQGVTWVSSQQCTGATNLLIRCGAPRALLSVCLDSKASTLRAAAFRALATVCSTSDAIRQIEQAGGIEIIADILSEDSRPEPELSEAVAVIAQITAPWIEDNHTISGLKENAKSLINSLTRILTTSQCCQNLLLCAAALANISCMEPSTVWPLLQCHTAEKLLTTVQKRGPKISVFLKEQVATLLANMSAANESRLQLGEAKAVAALLCFLQIPPTVYDETRASEQAANLRLQQKSAIALSRLCNERSISQQVVELGGVNQLVRLCKEKRERSHSDAVLVACLATLRKIASNCGNNVMEEQDAMELVEPRLLDSFLTYSSQNESYV